MPGIRKVGSAHLTSDSSGRPRFARPPLNRHVERLLRGATNFFSGSFFTVQGLLCAHGTHCIERHQHGMVTASWRLLAATHLQRVMRCDLDDDSCAV